MPLFFVTGIAGSGKTEIWHELKSRGYEAYDTDESGLAKWKHRKTGYIHPKSSVKKEDRTPKFLRSHSWIVPYKEVEDLAERAKSKNIFLCGVARNANELRPLFETVFALAIDTKTIKHRLLNRTNNDWGKQPHELRRILFWQRLAKISYRINGYIVIDATKSATEEVDEILNLANASKVK